MDGFERRRERKKESIRRAALELFSKHGVQKVSIAEIAEKANVSQVTIYNYFGSKDDLLRDVVQAFMDEIWKEYEELLKSDRPFPEKIKQLIVKEAKYAETINPDFLQAMMSDDPHIQQLFNNFYEKIYVPALMTFFDEGRKAGYVKQDISNEALLIYMNILKDGMRPEMFSDQQQNVRLSKELIELFFYGLLEKKTEEDA
ncbi:MAG TPA: TetR/AcrR family transcriptional regulator [Bacillales bacterium]|nr:TetR/AcrR family transcriptional regulator [Bacillales bacterium]